MVRYLRRPRISEREAMAYPFDGAWCQPEDREDAPQYLNLRREVREERDLLIHRSYKGGDKAPWTKPSNDCQRAPVARMLSNENGSASLSTSDHAPTIQGRNDVARPSTTKKRKAAKEHEDRRSKSRRTDEASGNDHSSSQSTTKPTKSPSKTNHQEQTTENSSLKTSEQPIEATTPTTTSRRARLARHASAVFREQYRLALSKHNTPKLSNGTEITNAVFRAWKRGLRERREGRRDKDREEERGADAGKEDCVEEEGDGDGEVEGAMAEVGGGGEGERGVGREVETARAGEEGVVCVGGAAAEKIVGEDCEAEPEAEDRRTEAQRRKDEEDAKWEHVYKPVGDFGPRF